MKNIAGDFLYTTKEMWVNLWALEEWMLLPSHRARLLLFPEFTLKMFLDTNFRKWHSDEGSWLEEEQEAGHVYILLRKSHILVCSTSTSVSALITETVVLSVLQQHLISRTDFALTQNPLKDLLHKKIQKQRRNLGGDVSRTHRGIVSARRRAEAGAKEI